MQPDPIKNNNPVIHELLIKLIRQRLDFGIKKYGVALQAFNGRRSLQDALDEILDLAVYTLQEIEERKILDERLVELLVQVDELKARNQDLETKIQQLEANNGGFKKAQR